MLGAAECRAQARRTMRESFDDDSEMSRLAT
jgi:hypothetical protein